MVRKISIRFAIATTLVATSVHAGTHEEKDGIDGMSEYFNAETCLPPRMRETRLAQITQAESKLKLLASDLDKLQSNLRNAKTLRNGSLAVAIPTGILSVGVIGGISVLGAALGNGYLPSLGEMVQELSRKPAGQAVLAAGAVSAIAGTVAILKIVEVRQLNQKIEHVKEEVSVRQNRLNMEKASLKKPGC